MSFETRLSMTGLASTLYYNCLHSNPLNSSPRTLFAGIVASAAINFYRDSLHFENKADQQNQTYTWIDVAAFFSPALIFVGGYYGGDSLTSCCLSTCYFAALFFVNTVLAEQNKKQQKECEVFFELAGGAGAVKRLADEGRLTEAREKLESIRSRVPDQWGDEGTQLDLERNFTKAARALAHHFWLKGEYDQAEQVALGAKFDISRASALEYIIQSCIILSHDSTMKDDARDRIGRLLPQYELAIEQLRKTPEVYERQLKDYDFLKDELAALS